LDITEPMAVILKSRLGLFGDMRGTVGVVDGAQSYMPTQDKIDRYLSRGAGSVETVLKNFRSGFAAELFVAECLSHHYFDSCKLDHRISSDHYDGWKDIESLLFGSVSVKTTDDADRGWVFQKSDPMSSDKWALTVFKESGASIFFGLCYFGCIKTFEFGEMQSVRLRSNKFALYPKDNLAIVLPNQFGAWRAR
jgi:hypothetical protein